jgi:hypothetical protein
VTGRGKLTSPASSGGISTEHGSASSALAFSFFFPAEEMETTNVTSRRQPYPVKTYSFKSAPSNKKRIRPIKGLSDFTLASDRVSGQKISRPMCLFSLQ